jgi:tetrahydromethanopterin S-methyltransferase subunit D
MKPVMGLLGALLLAIGGAVSFEALYDLLQASRWDSPSFGSDFVGFIGVLFLGIGLWVIVQSGRIDE